MFYSKSDPKKMYEEMREEMERQREKDMDELRQQLKYEYNLRKSLSRKKLPGHDSPPNSEPDREDKTISHTIIPIPSLADDSEQENAPNLNRRGAKGKKNGKKDKNRTEEMFDPE